MPKKKNIYRQKRNYNKVKAEKHYISPPKTNLFKKRKKYSSVHNNAIVIDPNSLINKYFNIKAEYFSINEDVDYNIAIPNNNSLTNYVKISEENYKFYYYIINHLNIEEAKLEFIEVQPNGNCFYNSISFFLRVQRIIHFYLDF